MPEGAEVASLQIPKSWKYMMAHLVRWPLMQRLMMMGIRSTVPQHRIGIAVVALDDQNRILMLEHVFHPYVSWGLPGGWLDRGESPRSGAIRELQEETGLSARVGPILNVSRQLDPESVNMSFLATDVRGTLKLSEEILNARWFTKDALPTPLLPFTRQAIQMAIEQRAQVPAMQPLDAGIE